MLFLLCMTYLSMLLPFFFIRSKCNVLSPHKVMEKRPFKALDNRFRVKIYSMYQMKINLWIIHLFFFPSAPTCFQKKFLGCYWISKMKCPSEAIHFQVPHSPTVQQWHDELFRYMGIRLSLDHHLDVFEKVHMRYMAKGFGWCRLFFDRPVKKDDWKGGANWVDSRLFAWGRDRQESIADKSTDMIHFCILANELNEEERERESSLIFMLGSHRTMCQTGPIVLLFPRAMKLRWVISQLAFYHLPLCINKSMATSYSASIAIVKALWIIDRLCMVCP